MTFGTWNWNVILIRFFSVFEGNVGGQAVRLGICSRFSKVLEADLCCFWILFLKSLSRNIQLFFLKFSMSLVGSKALNSPFGFSLINVNKRFRKYDK